MTISRPTRGIRVALAAALLAVGLLPGAAAAAVDPPGCTATVQRDPSIPTFKDVIGVSLGAGPGEIGSRRPSADLYAYLDAVVAATQSNPRVKVIKKSVGSSALGRDIPYVVVGTPEHIDNLQADAAFWRSAREGTEIEPVLQAQAPDHPAFGWITANIHGNEPAGGEASERLLYELAARTDCANARRLAALDVFIMPTENPDGRDLQTRETAWGFDPNRDWHTLTQQENRLKIQAGIKYPPFFYVDAHQQLQGYFFPPNEDPVHHEISDFAINFIQNDIGPALQRRFNDQSIAYRNYNTYDLFTPEYGDSVPSLLFGAAGMTFEKGSAGENYGKQVYDHYLAMDETVNLTARGKDELASKWIDQWFEAIEQGANGQLQENKLVSPLHTVIDQQPSGSVYGYYFLPDNHAGDAARLVKQLLAVGVHVYRLDSALAVPAAHEFGPGGSAGTSLPAGTLWVPMAQSQKHWIQAVLGQDPFIPFPYFYDVVTWSFSLLRGMSGNGYLTEPIPPNAQLTEISAPESGSAPAAPRPVYAFATDSEQALSLLIELADKGATVYRGGAAFDAGGVHFPTGTALVGGPSVSSHSIDLEALATARETPVYGLDSYPVPRFAIAKPKIGLFTGVPIVPPNPHDSVGQTGHCQSLAYGAFCQSYFVLIKKLGLPESAIVPVTSVGLAAGMLSSGGFTAFINPGSTITPDGAAALQAWVNTGGRYVATGANGTTSARTAGMTTVNTTSISGLTTPGSTYNATFNTAKPLAWGFDEGGFIYRATNGDPVYDPATLGGNPPLIPAASAVASYADPLTSFGYQVNSVGPGKLDGRPVAIDQPLGSGRVSLLGVNPFFRAWVDEEERLALNGALYPTGASIAPTSSGAAALKPASRPIPERRLRSIEPRPVNGRDTSRDIRVAVHRPAAKRLRGAVRHAHLPARISSHVGYERAGRTVILVIRGVRGDNFERRAYWVGKLKASIEHAGVSPIYAQV